MENLLNKEPVKRVQDFIAQFDPKLKVLSLNTTARTAKDAAESLGCEVGAIVKSLVFRADDTFLICLVAGDKRCSLNKLKKVISKKDVCMANAEEVKTNTGFSIGGVAPIAHLKKLNILIDQSLGRFQSVFAAAGHPNSIFKIEYSQLVQMTKGEVKEIIE
ncbi:MAG TPA: YbaK/EbsC family protein [Pelagibacteraceae bacterium]|jgi:Cys-tRNA(Pro) deacylase|nr:MAG: YbaK/EbsC family protein [Alphaproteobacteria bacterium]RUA19701.1 MAG: YbaK/EbsC family protein [Alphaproteobacteria bacterium]HIN07569.1 YbaK/EbsC family protein [Pelagibacteraceae bacterium]